MDLQRPHRRRSLSALNPSPSVVAGPGASCFRFSGRARRRLGTMSIGRRSLRGSLSRLSLRTSRNSIELSSERLVVRIAPCRVHACPGQARIGTAGDDSQPRRCRCRPTNLAACGLGGSARFVSLFQVGPRRDFARRRKSRANLQTTICRQGREKRPSPKRMQQ